MWISFKRILKAGFVSFWRNGFISLASVAIMTVTLFVFGALVFAHALLVSSLSEIQSRVDINVYFVPTADESDILALKKKVDALPEVSKTEYLSREKVLENFKARHENDEITIQALDELGSNPFGASLTIRAKETSQYSGIARFFDTTVANDSSSLIDSVNYNKNKQAIDSLTLLIDGGRKLGFGLTLLFVIVSIIISFNTIRLVIFISREEISVMRLVGASNKYIRGPFVVSGLMYGIVAGLLTLSLFFPTTYWFVEFSKDFFGSLNLFSYYIQNFPQMFILLVGSGAVSSFMAVRKYLRV